VDETRQLRHADQPVAGSGAIGAPAAAPALRAAALRTASLLRTAPDLQAAVPGLDWTVAEAAAHLVAELMNYRGFLDGTVNGWTDFALAPDAKTPAEHSAAYNAEHLAEFTERDPRLLADMLEPAVEDFLQAGATRQDGEQVVTGLGIAMSFPTMTTVLLGEQLVHGLDIARAASSPWPIDKADALQVIEGVMQLMPEYIDRKRAAALQIAYELRFRGGPRYRLQIDHGRATVTATAAAPVDCWISADPVAFLLVGYRRVTQWSQISRGRIVAGGRKPWLGTAFGRLLNGV
jgi:uncharacterized protein (TIGR03083 family)